MTPTKIEWTDEVWNVVTGCTRVSPGCANCYIERTPPFRMGGRRFERVGNEETTGVRLHPERLDLPRSWRKPRRVFVCSLADLFHEAVPDDFLAQVWQTMIGSPQHVFQVLTKRPERARDWLRRYHAVDDPNVLDDGPIENVWLGVSIENARFTWRADVLREIPAAVRFISAEPLLGSLVQVSGRDPAEVRPSDSRAESQAGLNGPSGSPTSRPERAPRPVLVGPSPCEHCGASRAHVANCVIAVVERSSDPYPPPPAEPLLGSLYPKGDDDGLGVPSGVEPEHGRAADGRGDRGVRAASAGDGRSGECDDDPVSAAPRKAPLDLTGIDWVIVGAESGHGARVMEEQWVRELRDACRGAGAAFFYKQAAERGRKIPLPELDGRQWAEMPEVRA